MFYSFQCLFGEPISIKCADCIIFVYSSYFDCFILSITLYVRYNSIQYNIDLLVVGMLQDIMYNYVNQNVKFMKKLNILSMLQQC